MKKNYNRIKNPTSKTVVMNFLMEKAYRLANKGYSVQKHCSNHLLLAKNASEYMKWSIWVSVNVIPMLKEICLEISYWVVALLCLEDWLKDSPKKSPIWLHLISSLKSKSLLLPKGSIVFGLEAAFLVVWLISPLCGLAKVSMMIRDHRLFIGSVSDSCY